MVFSSIRYFCSTQSPAAQPVAEPAAEATPAAEAATEAAPAEETKADEAKPVRCLLNSSLTLF